MAPNLNSVKTFFVFLGKSVFALLEVLVFAIIPRPQKNVAGEIVLITGSGSGLGRLLALKFARLGSVLVLWDVSQEGNEETCKMAQEAGATGVYAYTCDCSRKEEVYRVADQVKKEVGDVSILINNAGIVTGKKFLDCPDELMEKSFDVNFKAHLWTYKAFLPAMIANDHGHLVCISSSAGLIGVNGLADLQELVVTSISLATDLTLVVGRGQRRTPRSSVKAAHWGAGSRRSGSPVPLGGSPTGTLTAALSSGRPSWPTGPCLVLWS
nr:epidermal retinol dehydrogenase 2 isoform X2 [Globicephala melas]